MSKKPTEKELVEGLTPWNAHADELASVSPTELGIEASESDYKMALKRIEALFDAEPNTPEGDELEKLISFVEAYENKHHPI
ncbi:hypothetical protein [Photobacterium galatheae]|uniref:Transcriptional regulator n=1 Tax=Photobacterium galatheae TaxID=1654360 RepID=A0A066RRT9_9GAMM|nr:hypothetical protein [Photobacterium galatheae]KDM93140.1 hypothetical protein EA58_02815 [Photobacterium galatheae]MCM0148332.1 hypothetical protein [Photobacterium galatheae]